MSGLTAVLKTVRESCLPDASSRSTQYRLRKALCNQMTPYGRLVEYIDLPVIDRGKSVKLAIQNPQAMLYICCNKSNALSTCINAAYASSPMAEIVLYNDGISPADGLNKFDRRKLVAAYWSLPELGPQALCHEECWFEMFVIWVGLLRRVPGGLPTVLKLVLRQCFFNSARSNFKTTGTLNLL